MLILCLSYQQFLLFSQNLYLPIGTDLDTIKFKLISRTNQLPSWTPYSDKMKNSSTVNHASGEAFQADNSNDNLILIVGKINPVSQTPLPMSMRAEHYQHSVNGRLDVSPAGAMSPTMITTSKLPEFVVEHNSTPDRDTTYTMLNNGVEIRIRLDENADPNSVQITTDPTNNSQLNLTYNRHIQKNDNSASRDSQTAVEFGDDETRHIDMNINQVFRMSPSKFNLQAITHRMDRNDIVIFAPFNDR